MRFLCLHGMGTNCQIMESQIATIRYELDNTHTYDFVEGTLPASLAPELHQFFPIDGSYFEYFDFYSGDTIHKALNNLGSFLELEGPYDGVIAFSQGATLVATYLMRQALKSPQKPLPFQCAVFFCGGMPFDPKALECGEIKQLSKEDGDKLLPGFPTAHIWGRNDNVWPGTSEVLHALCDPKVSTMFLHDEGHSIPGGRAKYAVFGAVKAIRRTLDRVSLVS
ncbi:serine hydrolase FSH [Talaromyces proteolyticus]|uniref:Serine hydrolase FSH n=1 Tax=Talaromyces proteolyticus TaxID=1131652 RepID=A0AAD4KJ52_9EURO|nr:serine hydrolase FSH [Talaromyces proteolyticus]KAH8690542.1 serine hydrolase FSH [Talaromyces proteolyticus]